MEFSNGLEDVKHTLLEVGRMEEGCWDDVTCLKGNGEEWRILSADEEEWRLWEKKLAAVGLDLCIMELEYDAWNWQFKCTFVESVWRLKSWRSELFLCSSLIKGSVKSLKIF